MEVLSRISIPVSTGQNLHEQLAKHCDGIFSHGSHLPGLSQVVKNENGYVFFDPSLGNLFCPTNPQNTAVSTLLSGTVTDNSIIYSEEAIETTYENEHPNVELISEASKKTYLGSRWDNMHQQSFFSPELKDEPGTMYDQPIKVTNL